MSIYDFYIVMVSVIDETTVKHKKNDIQGLYHDVIILRSFCRFTHLQTQLEIKTREVNIVEERLKQSTHHLKVEDLKAHESNIGNIFVCSDSQPPREGEEGQGGIKPLFPLFPYFAYFSLFSIFLYFSPFPYFPPFANVGILR